ncbi:RING-type domain-containing protein [Pleurotus pulmonarius]
MLNNTFGADPRIPRPLVVSGSIIEISDSEDDFEDLRRPSQKVPLKQVASGALDNGATPAARDKAVPPERKGENAPPHAAATLPQTPPIQVLMDPPKPDLVIPQDQLQQVLEVVPDVQPEYAQELLTESKTVEATLNALFENPAYPKVDKKGKRKAEEPIGKERGQPKPKIDYSTTERPILGGPYYYDLALEQLQIDFPLIPKPYIRSVLILQNGLYVPAYLQLLVNSKLPIRPYKQKVIAYRPKGKAPLVEDPDFTAEREWLVHKLQEGTLVPVEAGSSQQPITPDDIEDGIECGCCFTSYPFEKMIQCPDAHLFCSECMVSYAENLLGSHNPSIVCMDQSGCKLPFPESELRRFLDDKLLQLYERVKQRKEIEMAGLEGLEECPFCEYKVVIENPQEKLFRCEREECGAVSCRACKKLDHLPKSCKEMEAEKLLDGRHAIEEAMTQALLRNCPKCEKAFIKEAGCNKMTCPNCRTLSCYVCRQVITGYDHFNQNASANSNKCLLWDQVEQRHADEVKAAAERATEAYRRENPDVAHEDIKVDLPVAPKPPAPLPAVQVPAWPLQLDAGALAAELFNRDRLGVAQRGQMVRQWAAQQQVPAPMPQPILNPRLPVVAVPPRLNVLPPPVQQVVIPRARRRRR